MFQSECGTLNVEDTGGSDPDPGGCQSNADCPSGEECVNGSCQSTGGSDPGGDPSPGDDGLPVRLIVIALAAAGVGYVALS